MIAFIISTHPDTLNGSAQPSYINFLSAGENVLFHMSFRPQEENGVVVFNSRTKDGRWGPEERVPLEGKFGSYPIITVYDIGSEYEVLFDNKIVINYKKRIGEDATALYYGVDSSTGPVFSDPLAVEIRQGLESDVIPRI